MGFASVKSTPLPPISDKVRVMSTAWEAEWERYVIGFFTSDNTPVSVWEDDKTGLRGRF